MQEPFAHADYNTGPGPPEVCIPVACQGDIVAARSYAREAAIRLGFSAVDATVIATAVSELARNIVAYASPGEIVFRSIASGDRHGILLEARDRGPGIADITMAMRDGYSSAGRLGLGLPGVRRLMDEFEITSETSRGTCIRVRKWLAPR